MTLPVFDAPSFETTRCPACAVAIHGNCHGPLGAACHCLCDAAIDARIDRGIGLLTGRHAPDGCLASIDPTAVNVASLSSNPVGLIWGYDLDGYSALGITEADAVHYGFTATADDFGHPEYRRLTNRWIDRLTALRSAPLPKRRAA